ncbi:MAG: carbonic anhydrase [Thermoleophilia bacterium]
MGIGRLLAGFIEEVPPSSAALRPRRGVVVLACMDPRIAPERILGLEPGDAHVIRNAGGVVTDDVVQSIGISQRELGTRAIVVLHHTGCTGMKARRPGVRSEEGLHDAVEALRRDVRLDHRDRVSGALYDTVGQVLLEGGHPRVVDDHTHAPAPARRANGASPRLHGPAAAHGPRCAWCGRPFGGVGSARRDARRRYCGDLCRIAARRGAHHPR